MLAQFVALALISTPASWAGRVLPPLDVRMGLQGVGLKPDGDRLLKVHKMPDGRIFGLTHSYILGATQDLFLVQWIHGKWTHPLFTGKRYYAYEMYDDLRAVQKEGLRLLDGGWIKDFIDNPAITKDSDGDGLNDRAEARLGTDPHMADTDGDGIPDSIDMNPRTKAGPQTNAQMAIAAVFRDDMKSSRGYCQIVISQPKEISFELSGSEGWIVPDEGNTLRETYGSGTCYVSFTIHSYPKNPNAFEIEFSSSVGPKGGLWYTVIVKKVKGRWIVGPKTNMRMS